METDAETDRQTEIPETYTERQDTQRQKTERQAGKEKER